MSLEPPQPVPAPLTALRAFEAAARHNSFQQAADELGVTPAAIAQQIKKLEDWAGGRLFDRHAHGVRLTAKGALALPELTRGLDHLGEAARLLRRANRLEVLRIAALPAIAQLWLSPRLSAVREVLPGVELSLTALDACPPLRRGIYDFAVYPGVPGAQVLARNALYPVAAPAVAAQLRAPTDLSDAVLIHDVAWRDDWRQWFKAHDISGIDPSQGPAHSLYSIAAERCAAGDGVLIGHEALIAAPLAEGRLTRLFDGLALDGPPICLVSPERAAPDPMVARAAEVLAAG
ncbi:MAG: LysR family transcriptional regulator [Pseudomonadota bacterium]